MIKTDISKEEYRKLIQAINYRGVELKETRPLPYDENPTSFQKNVEMMVTNGRGYLSIQNALDIVNNESPQMSLYDTFDLGLIPLYFKEPQTSHIDPNPCGEILLGETTFTVLPSFSVRQKTLLEKLKTQQRIHWMEDIKRKPLDIIKPLEVISIAV